MQVDERPFNLALILFIVIFITIGMISFKFGITNPLTLSAILWALVGLFDFGLGLLPRQGAATFVAAIIFIVFVFREAAR